LGGGKVRDVEGIAGLLVDGMNEDGACFQHKFPLDCGSNYNFNNNNNSKLHVA